MWKVLSTLATLTLCAAQSADIAGLTTKLVNGFLQSSMGQINTMTKDLIKAEGFDPWTPADIDVTSSTSMNAGICDIDVDIYVKINKVNSLGTFAFTSLQVSDIKAAGDLNSQELTATVTLKASLNTVVVETSGYVKTGGCDILGPYGGSVGAATINLNVNGSVKSPTLVASAELTIQVIDILEGKFCIKDATLVSSQVSYAEIAATIPNMGIFEPLSDLVLEKVVDSQESTIRTQVNNALESAVSGAVGTLPGMMPCSKDPTEEPTASPTKADRTQSPTMAVGVIGSMLQGAVDMATSGLNDKISETVTSMNLDPFVVADGTSFTFEEDLAGLCTITFTATMDDAIVKGLGGARLDGVKINPPIKLESNGLLFRDVNTVIELVIPSIMMEVTGNVISPGCASNLDSVSIPLAGKMTLTDIHITIDTKTSAMISGFSDGDLTSPDLCVPDLTFSAVSVWFKSSEFDLTSDLMGFNSMINDVLNVLSKKEEENIVSLIESQAANLLQGAAASAGFPENCELPPAKTEVTVPDTDNDYYTVLPPVKNGLDGILNGIFSNKLEDANKSIEGALPNKQEIMEMFSDALDTAMPDIAIDGFPLAVSYNISDVIGVDTVRITQISTDPDKPVVFDFSDGTGNAVVNLFAQFEDPLQVLGQISVDYTDSAELEMTPMVLDIGMYPRFVQIKLSFNLGVLIVGDRQCVQDTLLEAVDVSIPDIQVDLAGSLGALNSILLPMVNDLVAEQREYLVATMETTLNEMLASSLDEMLEKSNSDFSCGVFTTAPSNSPSAAPTTQAPSAITGEDLISGVDANSNIMATGATVAAMLLAL